MKQDNKESPHQAPGRRAAVLALSLLAGTFVFSASAPAEEKSAATAVSARAGLAQSAADWQVRQGTYYKRNWGVEIVGVKPVASGYMLAFRYRVLDPDKAKMMNDRHAKAYIIDEATGIRLAVPAMENVGELRSGSAPEANRTYFMIFGNPGKVVKSGSLVSVVAGNLQVGGLVVD